MVPTAIKLLARESVFVCLSEGWVGVERRIWFSQPTWLGEATQERLVWCAFHGCNTKWGWQLKGSGCARLGKRMKHAAPRAQQHKVMKRLGNTRKASPGAKPVHFLSD